MAAELDGQEIINLSENMDKSKEHLLQFIAFYCGEYSDIYESAKSLIQEKIDFYKWLDLFDGNIGDMSLVTWRFVQWKFGLAS